MVAQWVGMSCWEVTEDSGETVTVNRVIQAGATTIACECGGYYDERSKMASRCAHMEAIERHVEARAQDSEKDVARFFGD